MPISIHCLVNKTPLSDKTSRSGLIAYSWYHGLYLLINRSHFTLHVHVAIQLRETVSEISARFHTLKADKQIVLLSK